MRLLVVEDNEKLAALTKKLLTENGFTIDVVGTAEEAGSALDTTTYDLIILDLGLPDQDGVEILRSIRAKGRSTPVLVTTARGDVNQRVGTLNLGADDYIVKPYSLDELLARVRAILRRPKQIASPVLNLGNVTVDVEAMASKVNERPIELSRQEFTILASLLAAGGKLTPKRKLENAIYSFDKDVSPNAIEAAVSRLRKRLEAEGASIDIVAMRGLGYLLREHEHVET